MILKDSLFLCYSPPDEAQIREIVGWLNDPIVTRYSEHRHKCHTVKTQQTYLKALPPTSLYWCIFIEKTLIGTITAHVDQPNSVANIGLMIGDKSFWGKGWGFKAWQVMGDHLFRTQNIRKIEAGCMAINRAMNIICQKYGMVEEGRQDRHFQLGDCTTDLVHWGKFNETS